MTTQEKLIRNKLSLPEMAEYLKNVSEARKINGVPKQHFYAIKKNKPRLRNRKIIYKKTVIAGGKVS